MAAAPADLVFDPTHAVREVALRFTRPHALLSGRTPDGLTSRPHHAPRRFGRITWTALPATGIGLQPQTRRNQPPILYSPFVQIARKFFADFSKDLCVLRERYLKEALRQIRDLTADRAMEEMDARYSSGVKSLNEERETIKRQRPQVTADDSAEKALKKAESLLKAVENC